MILRAAAIGFVLWLAVFAVFRFAGQLFFNADEQARLWTFLSAPAIGIAAGFLLLKLLREARGDEGEAAIGVAMPTLILNAYATNEFALLFPALDPALDAAFGAWSLLFCGSLLITGLSLTRLAPQDERV